MVCPDRLWVEAVQRFANKGGR